MERPNFVSERKDQLSQDPRLEALAAKVEAKYGADAQFGYPVGGVMQVYTFQEAMQICGPDMLDAPEVYFWGFLEELYKNAHK